MKCMLLLVASAAAYADFIGKAYAVHAVQGCQKTKKWSGRRLKSR